MKIKIKKGDYNRVLLTDVLPYEVPILFSNEDFGSDSNLLIVFYVQIMPDDLVMQLHRF